MQREATNQIELQQFKEDFFKKQLIRAVKEAPQASDEYKTGKRIPRFGHVLVESEDDFRLLYKILREMLVKGDKDPGILSDDEIEGNVSHEKQHKEKAEELLKDLAGDIHYYYGIQFFVHDKGNYTWIPFHVKEHREGRSFLSPEVAIAIKEAPFRMSKNDRLQVEALERK
ncbi:MAG: hypothetical protein ABI758_06650 [Candidatus Woesebacteria bacterium]